MRPAKLLIQSIPLSGASSQKHLSKLRFVVGIVPVAKKSRVLVDHKAWPYLPIRIRLASSVEVFWIVRKVGCLVVTGLLWIVSHDELTCQSLSRTKKEPSVEEKERKCQV